MHAFDMKAEDWPFVGEETEPEGRIGSRLW